MRIENDIKLDYCDVLIKPKRSLTVSRSNVNLRREYKFLHSSYSWKGIPIIAANMDTVGTLEAAETLAQLGLATCLDKHYSAKELAAAFSHYYTMSWQNNVFFTMGIGEQDFEKLEYILGHEDLRLICIDVANGYQNTFVDAVKRVRDRVGDKSIIMAGNVVSPEMVQELLIVGGADIVKVGIGSGSCCTTRLMTAVGYPQLSATIECADAAHGCGGHICSDGGCCIPADVVKSFGAGADFVMLGGMLSGTSTCQGEVVEDNGKKYHKFYGMSSLTALDKYNGGLKSYRAAEGKEVWVEDKGDIKDVVQEILGGLRSACAYVGTDDLKHLSKCTTFIMVNRTHNTVYEK